MGAMLSGHVEMGGGDQKFVLPDGFTMDHQSKEVGLATRRSHLAPTTGPLPFADVPTLWENFEQGAKIAGDDDCLGTRNGDKYEWQSYKQVRQRILDVGSAMVDLGLKRDENDRTFVGIYGVNCVEWSLSANGCYTQSMIPVPLYDTLGAEAVNFIVTQTKMELVVCDNYKKAQSLIKDINNTPSLKHIVVMKEDDKPNGFSDDRVVPFNDFEARGKQAGHSLKPAKTSDLAIVCYTSGTTGLPKGVMLTHKALLCPPTSTAAMLDAMGIKMGGPGKTLISFLPLAHIFEQVMHIYFFGSGGRIGFFSGQVLKIMEDSKILQPTMFPLVPRLLSRLYDKVQSNLSQAGYVGNFLFNRGYQAKLGYLKQGYITKQTIWDKLIFHKVQAELGGKVECMITGAAPVSAEVMEMCRIVLGCIIIEGYGQTECSAAGTITVPGHWTAGHVGPPLQCNEVKLADVPDMEYFAKDNRGEICFRGPNVMSGYLNEPEKTAEALDSDGWLHTGDIGTFLPNGCVKVIDRKKHIFKLAQGEYVAPEKIESVFTLMPEVAQIFVDGISTEKYLIAVVVPEESVMRSWAKNNLPNESRLSLPELCALPAVKQHVLDQMTKFGKPNGLNSLECPKAIHLHGELFSVEKDLLTPTMKSKRPQLRKYFAEDIERMYKEGGN